LEDSNSSGVFSEVAQSELDKNEAFFHLFQAHSAAFDSYMTGFVFLTQISQHVDKILAKQKQKQKQKQSKKFNDHKGGGKGDKSLNHGKDPLDLNGENATQNVDERSENAVEDNLGTEDIINSLRNKIYLMGKPFPLLIKKSEFTKTSKAHESKKEANKRVLL